MLVDFYNRDDFFVPLFRDFVKQSIPVVKPDRSLSRARSSMEGFVMESGDFSHFSDSLFVNFFSPFIELIDYVVWKFFELFCSLLGKIGS